MAASPSVGAAIEDFVHYFSLVQTNSVNALTVSNGVARLSYVITDATVRCRTQDANFTLAMEDGFMRALLGEAWRPLAVDLAHAPGDGLADYQRQFGCKLRFGAAQNALYFPAAVLERVPRGADAARYAALRAGLDGDLSGQTRRLDLLRGFALRAVDVEAELVTTTGAAIVTSLASPASARPAMTLERIGYGAGRRDFPIPNVVRVMIGEAVSAAPHVGDDDVVVIEANIDDMSPQHFDLAVERVFAAGAVDVWMTPIVMKKGRPAIALAAIAPPAAESAVATAMLRETSTIGVRVRRERRHTLAREIAWVTTPFGPVRFKRATGEGVDRAVPEYDDVAEIARREGLPLGEVARIVMRSVDERVDA